MMPSAGAVEYRSGTLYRGIFGIKGGICKESSGVYSHSAEFTRPNQLMILTA